MADAETEAEWAKLRRIAKEKEKAARALEDAKQDKVALSCLDPAPARAKGFSRNRETVIRSVEKFANFSILFVIFGIMLELIGRAVAMTTMAVVAGILQGLGTVCLVVAIVSAVTGVISSIYTKIKYKTKMNYTIWVSVIALVAFGIYRLFVQ